MSKVAEYKENAASFLPCVLTDAEDPRPTQTTRHGKRTFGEEMAEGGLTSTVDV